MYPYFASLNKHTGDEKSFIVACLCRYDVNVSSPLRLGCERLPICPARGFVCEFSANVSNDNGGLWLSLVERFVRDEEVVGSNPASPTTLSQCGKNGLMS